MAKSNLLIISIILVLLFGVWFFSKQEVSSKKAESLFTRDISKDDSHTHNAALPSKDYTVELTDPTAGDSPVDALDWTEKLVSVEKFDPPEYNRVTSVSSILNEFGIPLPTPESLEPNDAMRLATALRLCSVYLEDPIEFEETTRQVKEEIAKNSLKITFVDFSTQCKGLDFSDAIQGQRYFDYAAENGDLNAMMEFAMKETMLIDNKLRSIVELLGTVEYRDVALELKSKQETYLKIAAKNGRVGAFYLLAEKYWDDYRQVEGLSLLMILYAKLNGSDGIKKKVDGYVTQLTAVEVDMAVEFANQALLQDSVLSVQPERQH